jgi:hypothetical protein
MIDDNPKISAPSIYTARRDGDLIPSALKILSVKSSRVNVREDGALGHPGTARDFAGFEVLLDRRERINDVDQLGSSLTRKRAGDLVSTLSQ